VNLSLGEFQSLVAKAFRGVGYPWGLTEEASFAARRLAECGLEVAPMMVRLLEQVDESPLSGLMPTSGWQSTADGLCPICVGTTIADQAGCNELSIGATFEPVLVAPFLAPTVSEYGYIIEWSGGSCEVDATGIRTTGQPPEGAVVLSIARTQLTTVESERLNRVVLDRAIFDSLVRYAHRTYAPATEESRLAGAGAGTTDND